MALAHGKLLSGSVLDDQLKLERLSTREGVHRYRKRVAQAIKRGDGHALKPVDRLILHWFDPLRVTIGSERRILAKSRLGGDWALGIHGINESKLAAITLQEVMQSCLEDPSGSKLTGLAHKVGKAVCAEINLKACRREDRARYKAWHDSGYSEDDRYIDDKSIAALGRQHKRFKSATIQWWARRVLEDGIFESHAYVWMGTFLLKQLVKSASARDYDEELFCPAFIQEVRYHKGKTTYYFKLSEHAAQLITAGHSQRETLRPCYLPMLVPPMPWTKTVRGGYITVRTTLITRQTDIQTTAFEKLDLSPAYDRLRAINAPGWRINGAVLAVARDRWERGGDQLEMPRSNTEPRPPVPAGVDDDIEVKKGYKRVLGEWHTKEVHRISQVEWFLQQIGVAERFKNIDRFYFPHYFDFRWRAYPIPPRLHYQGDCLNRGLLEFAEKSSSKTDSMYHLLVNAAGKWGLGRETFEDRVAWSEMMMREILAVAADPIGNEWWHGAKRPWEFLAACFAIADPNGAGARIPIQQDGSANGVQHYSALMLDPVGAKLVNLQPCDTLSNLYEVVRAAIAPIVKRDAERGLPVAKMVLPFLSPEMELIKQPVMTTTYGVTDRGATGQLKIKLDKLDKDETLSWKDKIAIGRYLGRLALDGVRGICPGAKSAMDWMNKVAEIVTDDGQGLRWTTPIGLPVVQPYYRPSTKTVCTFMGNLEVWIPNPEAKIKVAKQRQGFCPNYVHSLDATHMMEVALEMYNRGRYFAAVHDGYWTHACDVETMSRIARQKFIEQYAPNRLLMLRDELEMHTGLSLPAPPERGLFDISSVLRSPYFFN